MSAIAFLLGVILSLVDVILVAYMWILIIRAMISWVSPDPYNPIVRFLYRVTEPVLGPIRERLPMRGMNLDFSPIVVLLVIYFLRELVLPTLQRSVLGLG